MADPIAGRFHSMAELLDEDGSIMADFDAFERRHPTFPHSEEANTLHLILGTTIARLTRLGATRQALVEYVNLTCVSLDRMFPDDDDKEAPDGRQ